jgi:serine/threonine protein kinase/tetratricopeptide (TPR) repeat protein
MASREKEPEIPGASPTGPPPGPGPVGQRTETLAIPPADLSAGTLVSGRYEIMGCLGRGGMGTVYRALDREIGEEVALKVLSHGAMADPRAIERFRNELKLARRIVHKNVCRLYHFGEDRGTYYLVMEYVAGEDLRAVLRRDGKLAAGLAQAIALQVSEGLAEAHRLGIVHRDLKPANIVIDLGGNARIMDFGIARSLQIRGLTVTGALVGTPDYMSPEQVEGREADARSDIYSLGAMLFEILTGRPPFEADSALGAALKRRTVDPPDPRSIDPDVPPDLSRVILRCLAREPDERYQTAEELAADLDGIAGKTLGPVRSSKRRRLTPAARTAQKKLLLGLSTIIAALTIGAILFLVIVRPGPPITSIAVLPLQNLSGDPQQEYFSDGITEDIIAQLSKIGDLKVISRTSAWKYKGASKSIPEIGRELNVGAVLEGSVRREGDRIRIVSQLIDARKDRPLWAKTYDRLIKDVLDIQTEVAERIARELRISLSPEEKKRLARKPVENVEAYTLAIRAREHYYRYTKDDNEKAIELFQEAIKLDPAYAPAYAGLGDAHAMRALSFGLPRDELETALAMSRKALALDPELAEGHKALGLALESLGDEEGGLNAYYRAVEINPNYAPVISNIGSIQFSRGRYDEALKWLKKAVELQPGVARFYTLLALQYFYLGDDESADRWLQRAIEFQPEAAFPRLVRASIDLFAGRIEAARQGVAEILSANPDETNALDAAGDVALIAGDWEEARRQYQKLVDLASWKGQPGNKLAFALIKLGKAEEGRALLDKNLEFCLGLETIDKPGSSIRYIMAETHCLLGRKTEALDSLETAEANGYYERWIAVDPLIDGIRSEPRFKEIMDKFKGRIAAMRRRAAELD